MTNLRSKLIRLAHEKPELRAALLPILAKTADVKLTPKDKKTILAFLDHKEAEGTNISSDGKKLDGKWMGGRGIAIWDGDEIDLPDLGSRSAQTVQKAIRKEAPSKWIKAAAKLVSRGETVFEWARREGVKTASDKEAMRGQFLMPRGSYLPKNNATLMERKGTPEGLQIWTWEDMGRNGSPVYLAGAWAGKADKPMWFHTFRDINGQERHIQDTIKSYQSLVDAKRQRLEDQKNFAHGLQIGDILVSSWGYDQTNVDYYQVTRLYGKAIGIREIGKKYLSSDGSGSDKVAPDQGAFVGPEMKKIPRGGYGGASVKINSFASAYKWDGQPDRQTSSGWGH